MKTKMQIKLFVTCNKENLGFNLRDILKFIVTSKNCWNNYNTQDLRRGDIWETVWNSK